MGGFRASSRTPMSTFVSERRPLRGGRRVREEGSKGKDKGNGEIEGGRRKGIEGKVEWNIGGKFEKEGRKKGKKVRRERRKERRTE